MLPPLRARRDDLPALIARFWREITASQRTLGTLQASAVSALAGAYWPGNLDHLHNVIANLALTIDSEITGEHVRRLLGESALPPSAAIAPEVTARFFELPLREAREAFERIYFEQLLGKEQSNMSRVAERAGLERTHLYRKLKQLNIRFCASLRRRSMLSGQAAGAATAPAAAAEKPTAPLVIGAIGIVFGDIGTSPLYTLRECFTGPARPAADRRQRARHPVGDLLGADDHRHAQVRDADHARRQSAARAASWR